MDIWETVEETNWNTAKSEYLHCPTFGLLFFYGFLASSLQQPLETFNRSQASHFFSYSRDDEGSKRDLRRDSLSTGGLFFVSKKEIVPKFNM